MLADQADGGLGIVEGNRDDVGQHLLRRALGIGDRHRRVAAPAVGRRIEADFGIIVGAVIGAFAFGDLRPAGEGAGRLQRHHHGFGAGIGEADLLDRRQPRREQFRQFDFRFRRHAERRAQRQLPRRRLDQHGMRVAVDQRGEIIDAVDKGIAVDIQDPAAFAARRIDRIGLHEHGGAGIAARQARQRAIVQLLRGSISDLDTYRPMACRFELRSFRYSIRSATAIPAGSCARMRHDCVDRSLFDRQRGKVRKKALSDAPTQSAAPTIAATPKAPTSAGPAADIRSRSARERPARRFVRPRYYGRSGARVVTVDGRRTAVVNGATDRPSRPRSRSWPVARPTNSSHGSDPNVSNSPAATISADHKRPS